MLFICSIKNLTYDCNLRREDNNKLVPIILDRLQLFYKQFTEENEINQNTKPFSHLPIDQINNDNTTIKSPPSKKKSNFLYL